MRRKFCLSCAMSVPRFYVYDAGWMQQLQCFKRVRGATSYHIVSRVHVADSIQNGSWPADSVKHADDFWFLKHALDHPRRTFRPEEASLFIVGALLNVVVEQETWSGLHCCVGRTCGTRELIASVEATLNRSSWFWRRGGADHIVVASHWASKKVLRPSGDRHRFPHLLNCLTVSFEENSHRGGRCRVAKMHVGEACTETPGMLWAG